MNPILCIDPGASGGLALLNSERIVEAFPMRDGMTGQIDAIRHIAATNPGIKAVIEKVGFHRPGNSAVSTAKFARHCGHLEAALYSVGVPFEEVAPGTWMKALGALPADKTARKNAIKEQVARRFPHLAVTLKTADALGMLVWAGVRFLCRAVLELLTLASPKPDDKECGVDLGGQGRVSWRSGR